MGGAGLGHGGINDSLAVDIDTYYNPGRLRFRRPLKSSTRFVFGMTLFLNRASLRTIDSRQHHVLLHSLSMVLLTLEMASALSLFLSMTSANQSLLPPLISILSSVFITDVLGLVPLPPQAWKYGRLTMSSHGTSRRCGWTLIQTCRLSSTTGGLCNVLTSK